MLNTHFQGEITELQVAEAFLAQGYQVCKPLVSDSRYDFIVDINHHLYRIQVKTASLRTGTFTTFPLSYKRSILPVE